MRENNLTHDSGACKFKNCYVGDTDREEIMESISDRLPTKEDATKYAGLVWVYEDGEWMTCVYRNVQTGRHWAPMKQPPIPKVGPPPCPFCGEQTGLQKEKSGWRRWVQCLGCGAHGPSTDPEETKDPVTLWSRRAGYSHPTLTRPNIREETMKPITDRLPTMNDADTNSDVWVWFKDAWLIDKYYRVHVREPWLPIETPPPYEPPRELGPCPACGILPHMRLLTFKGCAKTYVRCTNANCRLSAPVRTTREDAIEAWEALRQPTWQPIETKPDGERVLLIDSVGFIWTGDKHRDATHWMPLPDPPKG